MSEFEKHLVAIWRGEALEVWNAESSREMRSKVEDMSPEQVFILGFMAARSYQNPPENQ